MRLSALNSGLDTEATNETSCLDFSHPGMLCLGGVHNC